MFRSCILPSCFNNNSCYFQTLLLTQFDGQVVVCVFRSLYHEMYLMPMNVESSNPLKFFQGGYLKTTERMQKKIIYFSPLSFVLLSSISIISIFLCFFLRSFCAIHSLSPLSCHSNIISDHKRDYQPPLAG